MSEENKIDLQSGESFKRPYPPSWFDRFTVWVDKLPGPIWIFYLLLGFAVVLVETAVQWREGAYPVGEFSFNHVWGFGFIVYELALLHYLDKIASNALESFKPLLTTDQTEMDVDDESYDLLLYRITTLPAWPTVWATIIGGAIALLTYIAAISSGFTPNYLVETAGTPLSDIVFMASFVPANAVAGVLLYHTIHQLRVVNHIYTRHAQINLYQLQPLYALSRLGAVTTIGLSGILYLFFLTTPEGASTTGGTRPFELALGTVFALIAALTFFLPLLGAHRRIEAEKTRRLEQTSSRFEATTKQLHEELDRGQLENMGNLNRALASLETEQVFLRKIPTWPWEPGVVRSLIFALLFPLVTWLLQLLLGRFLGTNCF